MKELFKKNKEFLICGGFLLTVIMLYHSLYFNNVFPVSDGWGVYYAELLERGCVPYRDFYYYLMPLSLGVDFVFWQLSFGSLFVFRLWYFLQRIAMIIVLYKLLCKFVMPRYASIGCIIGMAVGAGTNYDLVGDYNQTEVFLVILLMYALVKFFGVIDKEQDFSKFIYLACSGFLLGLIVLLKQSTAAAACVVCVVFLIAYCITCKDKNWWKYVLSVVSGALVPLLTCVIWLTAVGAFAPFLEQIFGVSTAKGGISSILLSVFNKIFYQPAIIIPALSLSALAYSLLSYSRKRDNYKLVVSIILGIITSYGVLNLYAGIDKKIKYFFVSYPFLSLIPLLFFGLLLIPILSKRETKVFPVLKEYNFIVPSAVAAVGILLIVVFNAGGLPYDFFYGITNTKNASFVIISYICGAAMLFALLWWFAKRAISKSEPFDKRYLPLLLGSFILYYACSMATLSSATVTARYMFVAAPVLFSIILSYSNLSKKLFEVKNLIVLLVCCSVCFVYMNQKAVSPYYWWGTETQSIDNRIESVDIPALRGFKLTKEEKDMYEIITAAIENNIEEGDTVWGFPHVKIFNILTDSYNVDDPVPVLFYDVCSADAARQELEWVKSNLPEIVVWCEIPNCIETHEHAGLDMSEHYHFFEWFNVARVTEYRLIAFQNDVCVYKLIEEEPSTEGVE